MKLSLLFDKKNWVKLLYLYWNNSSNAKVEAKYNSVKKHKPIYGFYHIFCMMAGWEQLVAEQLSHMKESGLYDKIEKLYCGILIKDEDVPKFKELFSDYTKIEFLYTSSQGDLFEFQTLIEMWKKTNELGSFIGFYFHTKGISWLTTNPAVYSVCSSWRLMNEYFLFDKYKMAISSLLNENYDVYGTNYTKIHNDKYRNLGLNFFWFKSDYVKTLKPLTLEDRSFRFSSEAWVLSQTHNVYCPFRFTGNDRNVAIPEKLYKSCSFWTKFKLGFVLYFTRYEWYIKNFLGLKFANKNMVVEQACQKMKENKKKEV